MLRKAGPAKQRGVSGYIVLQVGSNERDQTLNNAANQYENEWTNGQHEQGRRFAFDVLIPILWLFITILTESFRFICFILRNELQMQIEMQKRWSDDTLIVSSLFPNTQLILSTLNSQTWNTPLSVQRFRVGIVGPDNYRMIIKVVCQSVITNVFIILYEIFVQLKILAINNKFCAMLKIEYSVYELLRTVNVNKVLFVQFICYL